jgi:hypothetical protein
MFRKFIDFPTSNRLDNGISGDCRFTQCAREAEHAGHLIGEQLFQTGLYVLAHSVGHFVREVAHLQIGTKETE